MDADTRLYRWPRARDKRGEQEEETSCAGDSYDKIEGLPEHTQEQHSNEPDCASCDGRHRIVELTDCKKASLYPRMGLVRNRTGNGVRTLDRLGKCQFNWPGNWMRIDDNGGDSQNNDSNHPEGDPDYSTEMGARPLVITRCRNAPECLR